MAPVAAATETGKVGEAVEATGVSTEVGVVIQVVEACTAGAWAVEEIRGVEPRVGELDVRQTGILLAPDVGSRVRRCSSLLVLNSDLWAYVRSRDI